ncbi:MAG: MogA/MoaB family molybdenum cofactor biosynthesis protein [Chloroflexota bacterium]|nr:MogA/MoaB family molybdenum cofactor biosynthesis protein [Chloroflexota bacterium]
MINVGILTVSDKGSRGERHDQSGQVISELIKGIGANVKCYEIVPDEIDVIKMKLMDWINTGLDLVLTTGGTGLSPRDVTPEATMSVIDKLAPGIAEAIRAESMKNTPYAMLSRGVAGVSLNTLIVNLPGSPKAVKECLSVIIPVLPHAVETLRGTASECATRDIHSEE